MKEREFLNKISSMNTNTLYIKIGIFYTIDNDGNVILNREDMAKVLENKLNHFEDILKKPALTEKELVEKIIKENPYFKEEYNNYRKKNIKNGLDLSESMFNWLVHIKKVKKNLLK